MASLKEVKSRISSVSNTRKITSAMKMVASSKLHRAQKAIEGMRPYERSLEGIMNTFVANLEGDIDSPYAKVRHVKRTAIVLYTSNASLCGGFNANAIKAFRNAVERYRKAGVRIEHVVAIGKKGGEAARKLGFSGTDYSSLPDHPLYAPVSQIAKKLMAAYASEELDEVLLIYHHFKSSSTQVLTEERLLPISFENKATDPHRYATDYIIEPSTTDVVAELIPLTLCLKLFTALLDNVASEHAARIIAMQVATDNADDLLQDLTLKYNKTRQQAITNELLDIVAGSTQ